MSRLYIVTLLISLICTVQNAWLDETKAGIKIAGGNSNNIIYADDTALTAEREKELNILLMKVKEKSEKAGLKLSIEKIEIMVFGPIIS